jgi:hypothetical protein
VLGGTRIAKQVSAQLGERARTADRVGERMLTRPNRKVGVFELQGDRPTGKLALSNAAPQPVRNGL